MDKLVVMETFYKNPVEVKNEIFVDKFTIGDLFQRNFGLPEEWPNEVRKNLDKAYLITLYDAIKDYGYASGSLHRNYMVAFKLKDGSIQFVNSHRLAVLRALGYRTVKCFVVEAPLGWE